jgi:hypothetical protein
MKRFNINLPEDVYESLRKESFEKRVSMNSLVVKALTLGAVTTVVEKLTKDIPPFKSTPVIDGTGLSGKVNSKNPITSQWCSHYAAPKMCKVSKCKNYPY